ncbi:hypothetical protein E2C01_062972 [Portunus trituberculatus]|uniref:Uncharacterized protein n=1 Tax=Portunus trituberculatus TaxID=210409 RepID=A0A5B7HF52_PORTR|nr:hypothetical protein [Portunus trituberculatus]
MASFRPEVVVSCLLQLVHHAARLRTSLAHAAALRQNLRPAHCKPIFRRASLRIPMWHEERFEGNFL